MPRKIIAALFALVPMLLALAPLGASAQTGTEKRIALVVGNATYQAGTLATPANDAGLIAQTLQAAGFDVVGARDLDQDSLRRAFRDFVDKAGASGPDTVAFIYVAGYGLQLEGDNYFVPVDAKIARDTDVPADALRISDYTRQLAALKLKAGIVVLDAARANPFAKDGSPLAGGLALVEPEPGMLIAFNAAPGTVGPEEQGPYGSYAQALAENLREGGLPLAQVFDRTRLRVNDLTKGGEVPWSATKLTTQLVFFERAPDAPPPAVPPEQTAAVRTKPIRQLPANEAYAAALDRDTLQDYSDFVGAYPDDPMVPRVRVIIAARREAMVWRRTRFEDTPPAYWSYLRRYPDGPHAFDCRRRLAFLAAAFDPPPTFAVLAYDVPPPPPEEIVYIRRPVLYFDDPVFAFAPPPPPPVLFLGPAVFVAFDPPPPPIGLFVLPVPVYTPVPLWVRPPVYVAAPPANNVIFANVHNTVVINNVTNSVTVTNAAGQSKVITPPAAPGSSGAAALGPSLPPSVAQKAALQSPAATGTPGSPASGQQKLLSTTTPNQPGQALPGMKGQQPLPNAKGVTTTPSAAVTPNATGSPATGTAAKGSGTVNPAAKLTTTPSTATTSTTSTTSPASGGTSKSGTHPAAAKLTTTPTTTTSSTGATGTGGTGTSTPGTKQHAKPANTSTQGPAANLTSPSAPSRSNKPVTAPTNATSPVSPAAKLAPVSPPSPPKPPSPPPSVAAKPAPQQNFHPAAAPPPPPKGPPPGAQAKGGGCPPGKTPNGHGGCK
jgi:uncharacterized caspase-like protein